MAIQNKFTKHTKGPSAAQQEYTKYTQYISTQVIGQHGNMMYQPEERSAWRHDMPYKEKIERFLIDTTRTYIATMNARNANNPQFLQALIRLIADYLSKYTMQHQNRSRKKARELLMTELWDNCEYIQALIAQQRTTRQDRKTMTTKQIRAKKQRAERNAQAAKDYSIAVQVRQDIARQAVYKKRK